MDIDSMVSQLRWIFEFLLTKVTSINILVPYPPVRQILLLHQVGVVPEGDAAEFLDFIFLLVLRPVQLFLEFMFSCLAMFFVRFLADKVLITGLALKTAFRF